MSNLSLEPKDSELLVAVLEERITWNIADEIIRSEMSTELTALVYSFRLNQTALQLPRRIFTSYMAANSRRKSRRRNEKLKDGHSSFLTVVQIPNL